jgi:hypothetical protein
MQSTFIEFDQAIAVGLRSCLEDFHAIGTNTTHGMDSTFQKT